MMPELSEQDRFYHAFGKAMASWADVEYALSLLFQVCTGLAYEAALEIFFTPNSFRPRADLLNAALKTSELNEEWQEFIRSANKKARSYSEQRNSLAHGVMHPNMGPPLSDWRIKKHVGWAKEEGRDYHAITRMGKNFRKLSSILRLAFLDCSKSKPPAKFLQRLHELPHKADSN